MQYCDSMVKPLTVINLALASYGDGYKKSSRLMKLTASVVGTGKYLLSPEMRAKQVSIHNNLNSSDEFLA